MATSTPNYNLSKPTVGADDDIWGGLWNANADIIDTQMKANEDAAAANAAALDGLNGVPIGTVVIWYGTDADLPTGWGKCDGGVYTRTDGAGSITAPDLREYLVLGASNNADVGTTGQYNGVGNNANYRRLYFIMRI